MYYKIKKNSVSNYPNPVINCVVLCTFNEEDTEDKAVYWIPFQHSLECCIGKTEEEINNMILEEGQRLFIEKENQGVFEAIAVGETVTAPEVL